jgi:hypothetical protein
MPGQPRGSRIPRTVPRDPLIHTRPRRPAARECGRRHQTTVSGPRSSFHQPLAPLGPPTDAVTLPVDLAVPTPGPFHRPRPCATKGTAHTRSCSATGPGSSATAATLRRPACTQRASPPLEGKSAGRRRAAPAAPSRRSARLARALALAGHGENQAVPDRLRRPRNRRARRGIHRAVRRQRGRTGGRHGHPPPAPMGTVRDVTSPAAAYALAQRLAPRHDKPAFRRRTAAIAPRVRSV